MRPVLWQAILVVLGIAHTIDGNEVQGSVFIAASLVVVALARYE